MVTYFAHYTGWYDPLIKLFEDSEHLKLSWARWQLGAVLYIDRKGFRYRCSALAVTDSNLGSYLIYK